MSSLKGIIDLCISLLNMQINLFGFRVSLAAVFIWGLAIYIIVWLVFGIFK